MFHFQFFFLLAKHHLHSPSATRNVQDQTTAFVLQRFRTIFTFKWFPHVGTPLYVTASSLPCHQWQQGSLMLESNSSHTQKFKNKIALPHPWSFFCIQKTSTHCVFKTFSKFDTHSSFWLKEQNAKSLISNLKNITLGGKSITKKWTENNCNSLTNNKVLHYTELYIGEPEVLFIYLCW